MRIFINMPFFPFNPDIPDELIRMGHDVIVKKLEYSGPTHSSNLLFRKRDYKRLETQKPFVNDRLRLEVIKAHKFKPIDLFFSATDLSITDPASIEYINKMGITTINIAHDDIPLSVFNQYCKSLSLVFDYNWSIQQGAIQYYNNIGANAFYIPLGTNPQIYKPYNYKYHYDTIFMGVNKGYRRNMIKTIADNNIDIRTYGSKWRNIQLTAGIYKNELKNTEHKVHKIIKEIKWYYSHFTNLHNIFGTYLTLPELIKMYSKSKITINFPGYFEINNDKHNTNFETAPKGIKGRDIEATMCGAFYITEYSKQIAQMYKIGKEIETYRNIDDLINKIHYYLNNLDEAEAIRQAGRIKAVNNYTWERSIKLAFTKMGID